MKIFSPPENAAKAPAAKEAGPKKMGPGRIKQAAAPEKKMISEQEIREKLATHVETSNTAKAVVVQKNSQKFGEGFMNENMVKPPVVAPAAIEGEQEEKEESESVKDSHLLMSDVKLNDPKDPTTQEKLRSVLTKGAFSFNPREKETLEKILGNG